MKLRVFNQNDRIVHNSIKVVYQSFPKSLKKPSEPVFFKSLSTHCSYKLINMQ